MIAPSLSPATGDRDRAGVNVTTILMTGEDTSEFADFDHGETRYVFDRLTEAGPQRLLEGPVCAFVDWVMEDLSGLEMCRRLRADPRTVDAHITMVLESCDPDDKP